MPVIDHELERESIVHRQTSSYDVLGDHIFFPISHNSVRDLLGRLLTQLDALNLPDRAHRAAKTLIVADVWRWWDAVTDNAVTSYEGCLAPIVLRPSGETRAEGEPAIPSNRWGWYTEEEYQAAVEKTGLQLPTPPVVRVKKQYQ